MSVMSQTKRPDTGHIPYMVSINFFKFTLLCPNFKEIFENVHYGLWELQSGITRSL